MYPLYMNYFSIETISDLKTNFRRKFRLETERKKRCMIFMSCNVTSSFLCMIDTLFVTEWYTFSMLFTTISVFIFLTQKRFSF